MKNKKGISPLIATVLIIGFTIVIAALVITWGTGLFKKTVSDTEKSGRISTLCSNSNIEVVDASLSGDKTKVDVTLKNLNQDQEVKDFKVVLNYGD